MSNTFAYYLTSACHGIRVHHLKVTFLPVSCCLAGDGGRTKFEGEAEVCFQCDKNEMELLDLLVCMQNDMQMFEFSKNLSIYVRCGL
jgi:hypothetical protein